MTRRTVLILGRGRRVHHLYRDMAASLAADHRVVVLATPEELESFRGIAGIDVRPYRTGDIAGVTDARQRPVAELRQKAADIEHEIGLPVYKAASNFMLYGRLVKSFGGYWRYLESEEEILRAYVGAYEDLSTLFDEVAPDVVFYDTIDLITNYLAFVLAYRRGVFALDFRYSPLTNGRISVGFGLYRRNILMEHLYAHPELLTDESYATADDMLTRSKEYLYGTAYATVNRQMFAEGRIGNLDKVKLWLRDRRRLTQGLRNVRWYARAQRNRAWLSRHLTKEMPTGPYIVYFLPHLPEASTCSQAPRWVYADAIVEQLALNAPSDLQIVVKEHPRTYGRRGREFFAPLQEMPNVTALHPMIDNYQLVAGAKAIVAVTGSVGIEGILLGKRVGVLGRPYYAAYRGITQLDYPEDIFDAIDDAACRPEELHDERRRFFAAYSQSLYDFGYGPDTTLYPRTGGARWAGILREVMAFIETQRLRPADFATGFERDAWRVR